MYALIATQYAKYLGKEIIEYNLGLHTAQPRMDPYGKLKKFVGREYAHLHHIEIFWANCQDDKEVCMRHYMHMTIYFFKIINLFPVQNQILEDENTIVDPRYDVITNLPFPLIDWNEEEVNNLKILTKPVDHRTRQWVDTQITQLKL